MAKQKPENALKSKIKKYLKEEFPGSWWMSVHGGPWQQAGVPDLLGCVEGTFVGVEVKLPGGKHPVTPLQKATLEAIEQAGGVSVVATSPEEAASRVEAGLAAGASRAD
jgi:hypothetical protein